jgi:uncharacterized protein involved in outer membrane biogenesis
MKPLVIARASAPTSTPRGDDMPRILLWLTALVVLVGLAGAAVTALLLDEDKLVALAADAIQKQTGAILEVRGETALSFFPMLGVSLSDARLQLPQGQDSTVSVRSLDIGIRLVPLLSRRVEIAGIALEGLMAELPRAPESPELDTSGFNDKELDAFYQARREALAAAENTSAAQAVLVAPLALRVDRLSVTDSRISQIDTASGDRLEIEIISLQASDLNLDGQPVPLAALLQLPGGNGDPDWKVSFEGKLRIDQTSQLLTLEPVTLNVQGATAHPVSLRAEGTVELATQRAELALRIDSGETRGSGTVQYAAFESPQIDADLHLNLFDPALLALAGPAAAGPAAAPDPADPADEEALPLDMIRSIDTRARLAIDRAVVAGHAIADLRVQLRASEGAVKLRSLTGELHGGKLDAKATFDAKHNTVKLQTEGKLIAMDIPLALAAMGSEPLLSGMADIEWTLQSKGKTRSALIEEMRGPIRIEAEQAVLNDIGIEQMLCQVVALVNRESLTNTLPSSSRFNKLSAKLDLRDGKLRLSPLTIELPQVQLTGEGRLYLVEQNFSAKFAATLSPELARLDPACRVNERLTAIDWPINCKGDLSGDPAGWCSVDSEEILSDLATDELQRKLKKEAGKWLDKILPGK